MLHIFGHDIAADCGGGAQHNQNRYKLLPGEAHGNCDGEENDGQKDKLYQGCNRGGQELFQSLAPLEACTKSQQCQRSGKTGDVVDGFGDDEWKGYPASGNHHAQQDTENDGVSQDIFHGCLQGRFVQTVRVGACEGQNQHGRHIVEGDGADNHQRRHAGIAVDVLDKGDSQDSRAASVGRLDELSQKSLVAVCQADNQPDGNNAGQSHQKTVQDIFGVPYTIEIGGRNIPKK